MVDEMVDRLLDILADKLTERLSAGHKELYTAKELAERYGVSCATIKNMVQNVSARYTTHQRAGGPALTEFTGTDAQTITFDIELAAYLGVNPTKERERLQECVLNGTTLPFVLGNVVYGSYRWVIKSVKFKTLHTDAFGTPTWITASVSLLEYQRE